MTEANILVDHHQFSCSVCLSMLKNPVTIPCGHSYCMDCITDHWNQANLSEIYSCPQCRETFAPRPVLRKNNILANIVAKFKETKWQAASAAQAEDVDCDFCMLIKCKAVKSCLSCLASYCESHLVEHREIPALRKHSLVDAMKLQEKICSRHNKPIEIYCRTDQTCICSLCLVDEHRNHTTVSAAAERNEKQSELEEEHQKLQQRIQQKQKEVEELKQAVINIKSRAQVAVEDSEIIFTEMISTMEKKRSDMTQLIRDQEKAELSKAEKLLQQLEQEIAELNRKTTELDKLLFTQDHIHLLQRFQSLRISSVTESSSTTTVNQQLSFDGLQKSLSNLKMRFETLFKEELTQIPPSAEAKRKASRLQKSFQIPVVDKKAVLVQREDFLRYYTYLTLDPNTAHQTLLLSGMNRVVIRTGEELQLPDHSDRFNSCTQVLCREKVHGRCYWEIERSNDVCTFISVAYKGIKRKGQGKECAFGFNNQSWSLECSTVSLNFWHNSTKTDLPGPSPIKIGIYVDHAEGTLSFYSVSDQMKLLYKVQTKFTQPLYAGFGVYWGLGTVLGNVGSNVKLCDP